MNYFLFPNADSELLYISRKDELVALDALRSGCSLRVMLLEGIRVDARN